MDSQANDLAAKFFRNHTHLREFGSVEELAKQMRLLERHGLAVLNQLLGASGDRFIDVLAEHNFAVRLVQCKFMQIQYEPFQLGSRVDFAASHHGMHYQIEMKRLGARQREREQDKALRELDRRLGAVRKPVIVSLTITPAFSTREVAELFSEIRAAISKGREGGRFRPGAPTEVSYSLVVSSRGNAARIGVVGSRDIEDVSGVEARRIREKLRAASSKFAHLPKPSAAQANLLVIEALRTEAHLSGVSEALYGTEQWHARRRGLYPARNTDGAFCRGNYSRFSGVVLARRTTRPKLLGPYELVLFPHPQLGPKRRDRIIEALGIRRTIEPDEFP